MRLYLDIERVEPLSQAVVEAHAKPRLPHTRRKVTHKISLWSLINAVPIPVVALAEVAPALVMLRREHHIYLYQENNSIAK